MNRSIDQADIAAIRLVTLGLLTAGDFRSTHTSVLERLRAFDLLGIPRERFVAEAEAYSGELRAATPPGKGAPDTPASMQHIRGLLGTIVDRRRQRRVACLLLRIMRADARMHSGESRLLWEILVGWNLRLADVVADAASSASRCAEPRLPRVFLRRPERARSATVSAATPALA
jgi:hypothetical protein